MALEQQEEQANEDHDGATMVSAAPTHHNASVVDIQQVSEEKQEQEQQQQQQQQPYVVVVVDEEEREKKKNKASNNACMRVYQASVAPYINLLLYNKLYRWMWLSAVISTMGNWLSFTANVATVSKQSGNESSGLAVSGIFLTTYLPMLIVNPFAGVVADSFDRRKVMIASDLCRGVVVLGFLIVQNNQRLLWMLYVLNALVLGLGAFFDLSREGTMPSIVSKSELMTANSLDSITWCSATFIGSSLGAFIAGVFGATANYIADSLSFILSAIFVAQLLRAPNNKKSSTLSSHNDNNNNNGDNGDTSNETQSKDEDEAGALEMAKQQQEADVELPNAMLISDNNNNDNNNIVFMNNNNNNHDTNEEEEIGRASFLSNNNNSSSSNNNMKKEAQNNRIPVLLRGLHTYLMGLRLLWRHKYLMGLVCIKFSGSLVTGCTEILALQFAERVFKLGDRAVTFVGVTNALLGISAGTAPVVSGRLFKDKPPTSRRLLVLYACFFVVGTLVITLAPNAVICAIGYMLVGVGQGAGWTLSVTMIQQVTPNSFLGRVFSFDMALFVVGKSCSSVASALLLDYGGSSLFRAMPRRVCLAVGTSIAVCGALWWIVFALLFRNVSTHETLQTTEQKAAAAVATTTSEIK